MMFESAVLVLAILVQLANTYIISYFFIQPFSEKVYAKNPQKAFLWLFFIRLCIIAICDMLGTIFAIIITYFDIFLDFIGAFIIVPLLIRVLKVHNKVETEKKVQDLPKKTKVKIICQKCGELLKITDSKCPKCGAFFSKDNIKIIEEGK